MPRDFHSWDGPWNRYAPKKLQAALSMPTPMAGGMFGRMELVIGRLGAGKTTWGALRCRRLANASGRALWTTGQPGQDQVTGVDQVWPEIWSNISSFEQMEDLRSVVVLWDEIHLMLSGSKGLLGRDHERFLIRWLSLCRKREICVVGTTQSWTRCATHYRQLVTTVWRATPIERGKLHRAIAYDPPEDGGKQALPAQWFGPAAAGIPTNASVWTGYDTEELTGILDKRGERAPASRHASGSRERSLWAVPTYNLPSSETADERTNANEPHPEIAAPDTTRLTDAESSA